MTFGERLQYALNLRNKRASDLSRATGLSQPLISQYLSDKFEAKNDKVVLIANYLKIDPLWLMGLSDEMSPSNSQWGNDKANQEYLSKDPDLLALYNEVKDRQDIYILFDKIKDLEPRDVESVLMFVQTIRKAREFDE